MRRKILTGIILAWAAGRLCLAGEDTGYRVKAMMVNGGERRMEGKFVVLPEDLRIVCEGDTRGVNIGDYVKIEFKSGQFVAGKMKCMGMKWYH